MRRCAPRRVQSRQWRRPHGWRSDVAHPGIDMMSFTVPRAPVSRLRRGRAERSSASRQELGGKSANIILEDADLKKAVTGGVMHMFSNSGQ